VSQKAGGSVREECSFASTAAVVINACCNNSFAVGLMFSSSSRQRNTKFCASSSFTNLRGEIRRREKGIRIVLGDLSFEPLVDFQLVSFFRESVNRLAKELLKVRYISNRTSIPFTYQFNDQNAKCVDISLIGEIPSLYNFRRAISPRST
jgi:hypothetical protein